MSMHGRRAEAWNRAALQPPRAHGAPLPPATFKAVPEDFHVEERLSFEPSGTGPHWLLRVEKRTANTRWVAAEIARLAGVAAADNLCATTASIGRWIRARQLKRIH